MVIDNLTIRKAVHRNNLLWSVTFFDTLVSKPEFDLTYSGYTDLKFMSSAQAINIQPGQVEEKIQEVENYYHKLNKPASFYFEPSSEPTNLKEVLAGKNYQEDSSQEEVWWGMKIGDQIVLPNNSNLVIEVCDTKEKLHDHVDAAIAGYGDFGIWAETFLRHHSSGHLVESLKIVNYVGYVDRVPASCSTLGVYEEMAFLINTAVVPEYRKRGIHTAMMLRRLTDAADLGAKIAFYQTDHDNEASIATGKKVGFTESFRRKLYYKNI